MEDGWMVEPPLCLEIPRQHLFSILLFRYSKPTVNPTLTDFSSGEIDCNNDANHESDHKSDHESSYNNDCHSDHDRPRDHDKVQLPPLLRTVRRRLASSILTNSNSNDGTQAEQAAQAEVAQAGEEVQAEEARPGEEAQPTQTGRAFSRSPNFIDRAIWPPGFVHRPHELLLYNHSPDIA
jgi:hypothetical protein